MSKCSLNVLTRNTCVTMKATCPKWWQIPGPLLQSILGTASRHYHLQELNQFKGDSL